MRRAVILVAFGALLVAGCGATAPVNFKGKSASSPPVDVSVYVSGQHVLVSPRSVGAGLITFNIVNQAPKSVAVYVAGTGGNCTMAVTGPMAPGSTAQTTLALTTAAYTIGPCRRDGAPRAGPVPPASLNVGAPRKTGDAALLEP